MVYGYIRVSTEKQTLENQRFEIKTYCHHHGVNIDHWITESISGTITPEERKLGPALQTMGKGDILICAELSRLGRNLLMIMSLLHLCMVRNIQVWTIKDNYRLGTDITSKVLAFAFGLSAEIERDLISQRTREALARKRAEGISLGRPIGKPCRTKLSGRDSYIRERLAQGIPLIHLAKELNVHRSTLARYLERRDTNIEANTFSILPLNSQTEEHF